MLKQVQSNITFIDRGGLEKSLQQPQQQQPAEQDQ
jgi:hypothetical protein